MGPRLHTTDPEPSMEKRLPVDKRKISLRKYIHASDLQSLTCGLCGSILKEPMQLISCGCRYCLSCISDYVHRNGDKKLVCPDDEEEFSTSQIKKDKGCKKEIEQLRIGCQSNPPCGWEGALSKLEEHITRVCPNTIISCQSGCSQQRFPRHKEQEHAQNCPRKATSCKYCSKRYPYNELEEHYHSCPFHPITCNFCRLEISRRSEFSAHLEVCTECELDCPMAKSSQCSFTGKRGCMTQHVLECHLLSVVDRMVQDSGKVEALEKSNAQLCDRVNGLEAVNVLLQKKLKEKDDKIKQLDSRVEQLDSRVEQLDSRVEQLDQNPMLCQTSLTRDILTDLPEETDLGISSRSEATQRGIGNDSMSSYARTLPSPDGNECRSLANIPKAMPSAVSHMMKEMVDRHENQIFHLHSEMQTIQQNFNKCTITLDDMKLRQDIQEVKTTNGSFIWKIPDIRRRYRDALEGKTVSLYSPPFRTSTHGYRMCMRIYLNGDGSGKGTYLSLFFVLMRSEHDNLLEFPFRQSVRFTLINQVTRSDSITEAFAPDLNSQSFQRPKSDMNVASGFPKFAKQAVLHDENFTKGNAIFIKAHVDLAGLLLE